VDFTEKVRVEIIAPDELVDALVDHIVQVATTGQTGDGLVWVVTCSGRCSSARRWGR
jgi:nitrogen regulatory protein P-II 1